MSYIGSYIGLFVAIFYGYWKATKDMERCLHEMVEKGEASVEIFEKLTKKPFRPTRPKKVYPQFERLKARGKILHDIIGHILYMALIAIVVIVLVAALAFATWFQLSA
jgi:hypothetical protein